MRRNVLALVLGLSLLGSFSGSAAAHHSWARDYDATKTVTLVGKVSRLVFRSPHSAIMLEVPNENGRNERWTLEWGSPQGLRERGVNNRTLRVGDELSVSGTAHRNPRTRSIHLQSLIRLSDGLRINRRGQIESAGF